jgi:hypothetical protein
MRRINDSGKPLDVGGFSISGMMLLGKRLAEKSFSKLRRNLDAEKIWQPKEQNP